MSDAGTLTERGMILACDTEQGYAKARRTIPAATAHDPGAVARKAAPGARPALSVGRGAACPGRR